jgi:hypothetical protein
MSIHLNIEKPILKWHGIFPTWYSIFRNDTEHVCDNPECETLIEIGESTIKKAYLFKEPDYFHERCVR